MEKRKERGEERRERQKKAQDWRVLRCVRSREGARKGPEKWKESFEGTGNGTRNFSSPEKEPFWWNQTHLTDHFLPLFLSAFIRAFPKKEWPKEDFFVPLFFCFMAGKTRGMFDMLRGPGERIICLGFFMKDLTLFMFHPSFPTLPSTNFPISCLLQPWPSWRKTETWKWNDEKTLIATSSLNWNGEQVEQVEHVSGTLVWQSHKRDNLSFFQSSLRRLQHVLYSKPLIVTQTANKPWTELINYLTFILSTALISGESSSSDISSNDRRFIVIAVECN